MRRTVTAGAVLAVVSATLVAPASATPSPHAATAPSNVAGPSSAVAPLQPRQPATVRAGTIAVDVDVRGATPGGIPAVALAYPLDPDRAPVAATLKKGKARLSAAAGWWVVATSVPSRRGPARTSADLVRVGGRALRIAPAAGPGGSGISLGTVTTSGWPSSLAPQIQSVVAAAVAKAAAKAPCRPSYSPTPAIGNPIWNAIRKATGKAARTGPAGVRDAARAAATRLSTGAGGATLSASVTRTGPAKADVTVRITDASGRVVSERSGSGNPAILVDELVAQALDDLCNDRGRVAVDVLFVFDATDTSTGVRGTATVTLNAIGIEPRLPDGTVERGAYEYAAPTPWVVTDWQVVRSGPGSAGVDPSCAVTKTVTDAGLVEQAPTQIAVRSGTGYRVQLAPAILLGYDLGSPCSGSNAIPVSVATQPAIVVDVPGLGQTGTKAGELSPPGLTASYAVDVTVRPVG